MTSLFSCVFRTVNILATKPLILSLLGYCFPCIPQPKQEEEGQRLVQMSKKRLNRSENKVIAGVCSGIAERLGQDPAVVRAIGIIFTVLTLGFGALVYLVFWVIMPEGQQGYSGYIDVQPVHERDVTSAPVPPGSISGGVSCGSSTEERRSPGAGYTASFAVAQDPKVDGKAGLSRAARILIAACVIVAVVGAVLVGVRSCHAFKESQYAEHISNLHRVLPPSDPF